MFQPSILGNDTHGIVEQLVHSISSVSSENHRQLLENTVLCGGTATLTGQFCSSLCLVNMIDKCSYFPVFLRVCFVTKLFSFFLFGLWLVLSQIVQFHCLYLKCFYYRQYFSFKLMQLGSVLFLFYVPLLVFCLASFQYLSTDTFEIGLLFFSSLNPLSSIV